jgi:cytochrome bd ubiquinol oxidase subunit I
MREHDILFARGQMAMSLAFHIVFAVVGIAMPVLMVMAEVLWLRTRNRVYLDLTRAWAKGTAVLFAVGAVSGTVLSFELGLLFPTFMKHAGPVIGMPFSLEGFAFFTEAIFLGIYLYGWNRVRPVWHVASGVVVAISGTLSAVFVVIANAWMNAPRGFRVEGDRFVDIDPIAAMGTPFAVHEVLHMLLAAFMVTGFAVGAIHAAILLKRGPSPFHRTALALAFSIAAPSALLQGPVGHLAAQEVAEHQPMKLAAMESQFKTEAYAPLRIGGFPDEEARVTRLAIEIPGGLSFLSFNRRDAVVKGLEEFPRRDWPSPIVHYSFQAMVGIGTMAMGLALWGIVVRIRKKALPEGKWFLRAIIAAGPLSVVALEAGWVVTEVGRQPWIVYGVMRTADTVTPMPGLFVPFACFTLLYIALAFATAAVLWRQIRHSPGVLDEAPASAARPSIVAGGPS